MGMFRVCLGFFEGCLRVLQALLRMCLGVVSGFFRGCLRYIWGCIGFVWDLHRSFVVPTQLCTGAGPMEDLLAPTSKIVC